MDLACRTPAITFFQRFWPGLAVLLLAACNRADPVELDPGYPTRVPPERAATPSSHIDQGIPALPVGLRWQWQLTGLPVDLDVGVDLYDIDLFDNNADVVAALHAQGRQVICYMSVGTREAWRPDADQFPFSVIGKEYSGWPDESWLDIRQIELLAPIIRARLDLCVEKGFDGVEPDNVDGYTNDTGFPLSYEDQIGFNRWLAAETHSRGLSIGLKNDSDQVADLLPYFDWALTEDCFAEGWCTEMLPFILAGKPVLAAEYTDTGGGIVQLCQEAQRLDFSLILKHRDLDAWLEACP
jgi:hypothetical protein